MSENHRLIDFLIERTKDVETPVSLAKLSREYKETSGVEQTVDCLRERIQQVRPKIHSLENIGMDTKIKMIFALSVPVNADFMKKLKKDALVDVDKEKRITHYKANDGSLELKGDHSVSAKQRIAQLGSKRYHQKLIRSFSKNNENADEDSENEEKKEMRNLIKFITEKCENVFSPFNIRQLAKDFIIHFEVSRGIDTIRFRISRYGRQIQKLELLDTSLKVKQLYGLSVPVGSNYLEELRKEAVVEVDEQNRITLYKAHDGSLQLKGDHSKSAKQRAGHLESERCYPKLVRNYFENKDDADGTTINKKEREMINLINFITEKCEYVDSPLNILQLSRDFNSHFGTTLHFENIRHRIKAYCREIQSLGHLDTTTKVKQLFGLSASVDPNCLEELRKEAIVEVDDLGRITKYTANDNSLTLHRDHSRSAKTKLGCLKRSKNKTANQNSCDSGGKEDEESEEQDDYSDEDSDEYSSEEFDSECDSDNENLQGELEDQMDSSTGMNDLDYETALRCHSPSEIPIENKYDYDSSTERFRKSENTEIGKAAVKELESGEVIGEEGAVKTRYGRSSTRCYLDSDASQISAKVLPKKFTVSRKSIPEENYDLNSYRSEITENEKSRNTEVGTTGSGRVSKKRDLDANFFEEQEDIDKTISCSKTKRGSVAAKTPHSSIKKRKAETTEVNSAKRNKNDSMSPEKLVDHDPINQIDDPPKVELQPFQGRILDNEHLIERDEDIRRIQKPYPDIQVPHENIKIVEVPIKVEYEVPVKEENPMEEVKPESTHNPKIKFFETIQSLILCLQTPSLLQIQSKIQKKILEIGGSEELIQNNEVVLVVELLITRVANSSSTTISGNVESVGLIQFLCYLTAAILNSKISGMKGLLENIKGRMEEAKNKRIPMEKVASALRATLDVIGF